MLCPVVIGPTFKEALKQVRLGSEWGGLLEFRLDFFDSLRWVKELKKAATCPVIFTFRDIRISEELIALEPDYVDVEHEKAFLFQQQYPSCRIICSYHNFDETPENLESILQQMPQGGVAYYKIATMARSTNDALRMLRFLQQNKDHEKRLVGICMGEFGQITRILGKIYGSAICYCSINGKHQSALGQLDVKTLVDVYRYQKMTSHSKVCGLIGDPVSQSPGHFAHNEAMEREGLNAVYVKMQVQKHELPMFINLAKELHFHGLSVTMPLKEAVVPFLSDVQGDFKSIGAINTLMLTLRGVQGTNTDGVGALDAFEKVLRVKGKKIILLGAGGTAKAIASEVVSRGANLVILNRTSERARELAESLNCEWGALESFSEYFEKGYDGIINATTMREFPEAFNSFLEGKVAMDILYHPLETPFLQLAKRKGCSIVTGLEMFQAQAVKQREFWFSHG